MKFKVLKGTKLYDELTAFHARIKDCIDQANKLAIELGGTAAATNGHHAAGGIDGIHFVTPPDPKKWKKIGNSWDSFYSPRASEKALWARIAALPVVDFEDFNKITKFKGGQTLASEMGFAFVKAMGVHWGGKNYYLLFTKEGTKYKPHPDMIEIMDSEWDKLYKKIK